MIFTVLLFPLPTSVGNKYPTYFPCRVYDDILSNYLYIVTVFLSFLSLSFFFFSLNKFHRQRNNLRSAVELGRLNREVFFSNLCYSMNLRFFFFFLHVVLSFKEKFHYICVTSLWQARLLINRSETSFQCVRGKFMYRYAYRLL